MKLENRVTVLEASNCVASVMVQQFVTKLDDLSSIPRTHMAEWVAL